MIQSHVAIWKAYVDWSLKLYAKETGFCVDSDFVERYGKKVIFVGLEQFQTYAL